MSSFLHFLNRSLPGVDIRAAANPMIFLASTNILCIRTGPIQLPLPVQMMRWNLNEGVERATCPRSYKLDPMHFN